MKKLEFVHEREAKTITGMDRRDFLKAGALGFAALSTGCILLYPKRSEAQALEVNGVRVSTERISNTVQNLINSSTQYQLGERTTNGIYTNGVNIAQERCSSSVTFRPRRDQPQTFGVMYPPDRDPNRDHPGSWGTEINDFAELIRRITSTDLRRTKFIVDRTVDSTRNDPIISVYTLPTNANGDIIGQYRGGYLAMGASYYPQRGIVYGARCLLLEPGVREPA